MPYTYNKDAEERHGTRHHAYTGVAEVEKYDGVECACGEKTVLAHVLVPVSERFEDVASVDEWEAHELVNPRCVALAREELGVDPPLASVDGVDWAKAHQLCRGGFETVRHLKEASTEDLTEVTGVSADLAERIKEDVGTYESYRDEWEVLEA